ncbi:MAG: undecaprenyl-diphosphate phosphatase [Patescibacteria group bacterium]|nr:undecaprenyl-diphosphate phosphatase [Patescibacteria group bacterium]
MDFIHVLILGAVEGLTEFLPVSSTAHLIITSKLLKIPQSDFLKVFEVVIQSGAILSVIFLYFNYLLKNRKIIRHILISFLPTAVIGFFLHKIIKNIFFESFALIVFSLFLVGVFFIIFEKLAEKKKIILKKELKELNFFDSFLIGFFQSLAVVPGVSRAGAVILGMMGLEYRREEATTYSFLLAVPTIISAGALDIYKEKELIFSSLDNFWILSFGFLVSFVFAFFSVKWFIDFVKKKSLVIFGVYRIILAFVLFLIVFM